MEEQAGPGHWWGVDVRGESGTSWSIYIVMGDVCINHTKSNLGSNGTTCSRAHWG